MILTFTPMRSDTDITLVRDGDSLAIDGVVYDFTDLPEGAILPREAVDCPALMSDVTRTGGMIALTLILPHGANPPKDRAYPAPVKLRRDGPVDLPAFDTPTEEAPDDH